MFYRLNRFSALHRVLRRAAYGLLWALPDGIKWPLLGLVLRRRLPYRLLGQGDTAVQLGAPWDILRSGRSRAIHLSRAVGASGHVVVVEPDPENVRRLRAFVEQRRIANLTIVPLGAWSKTTRLAFLADRDNPASNLVQEVVDRSRSDLERFHRTEIAVDTLDNILHDCGATQIKLVSITTNGAENEILKGMTETVKTLPYIATIADESEIPMLSDLGFRRLGRDDRGYTFIKA